MIRSGNIVNVVLIIILLFVSISISSQSEDRPLDEFTHMILVSDSIKTNVTNKVNIFISDNNKVYLDHRYMNEIDVDSICFLINNISVFPLSIIISSESSVKIKFYKLLVQQLKECIQILLDMKSEHHFSAFFSRLDASQKQFIKDRYSIYLFDSDY